MKNRLFTHLEYLIATHNCVAIPTLGSFVLNSTKGMVHVGAGIMPPSSNVSFNADLSHDDGVITSHIANIENITYNVASKRVKEAARFIHNDLLRGNTINCGDLGVLYMDETKEHILFKSGASYLHPSLFGLAPITMSKLDRINQIEKRERKTVSMKQTIGSIVAAAATVFLLLAPTSTVTDSDNTYQAGFVKSLNTLNLTKNTEVTTAIGDNADNASTYYVVMGGVKSGDIIQKELNSIKKEGFTGARILKTGDEYRIYVAEFSEKSEAQNFFADFEKINKASEQASLYAE